MNHHGISQPSVYSFHCGILVCSAGCVVGFSSLFVRNLLYQRSLSLPLLFSVCMFCYRAYAPLRHSVFCKPVLHHLLYSQLGRTSSTSLSSVVSFIICCSVLPSVSMCVMYVWHVIAISLFLLHVLHVSLSSCIILWCFFSVGCMFVSACTIRVHISRGSCCVLKYPLAQSCIVRISSVCAVLLLYLCFCCVLCCCWSAWDVYPLFCWSLFSICSIAFFNFCSFRISYFFVLLSVCGGSGICKVASCRKKCSRLLKKHVFP